MNKIIGIKIPFLKQVSYIKCDQEYEPGAQVIVNSNNGLYQSEIATKLEARNLMHNEMKRTSVVRLASKQDQMMNIDAFEDLNALEQIVKDGIEKLKLEVSYIGIWPSIDQKFVKIYYYSNAAIKFADIINYILKNYRKRIRVELVQVGTREYHGMIGGIGVCGYELCCHARHYSAPPITTETIRYIGYRITLKDQLIGSCSKYKCCLLYEADEYRHYLKHLPNFDKKIKYEGKVYKIADINIFTKQITIVNRYNRIDLPFDYFINERNKEKEKNESSS